jgi:hypothetical protein
VGLRRGDWSRRARPARDDLRNAAGKAALQVLAVAVLGALLTQLPDDDNADRERATQDQQQCRQDKYDRLVEATNTVGPLPIYLEAAGG